LFIPTKILPLDDEKSILLFKKYTNKLKLVKLFLDDHYNITTENYKLVKNMTIYKNLTRHSSFYILENNRFYLHRPGFFRIFKLNFNINNIHSVKNVGDDFYLVTENKLIVLDPLNKKIHEVPFDDSVSKRMRRVLYFTHPYIIFLDSSYNITVYDIIEEKIIAKYPIPLFQSIMRYGPLIITKDINKQSINVFNVSNPINIRRTSFSVSNPYILLVLCTRDNRKCVITDQQTLYFIIRDKDKMNVKSLKISRKYGTAFTFLSRTLFGIVEYNDYLGKSFYQIYRVNNIVNSVNNIYY